MNRRLLLAILFLFISTTCFAAGPEIFMTSGASAAACSPTTIITKNDPPSSSISMTTYYLSQQITVSAGTVITSWEIAVAGLATTTMSCHFETDSGSGPTGTTVSGSTVDLTKVFSATMTYETFTPASPLTMLAGTYNVVCHNPGDLQWGYKSGGSFYYDADGAGAYTHNEANGLSIKVNGCGSGS